MEGFKKLFYGFKVPERAARWNDDAEFADKVLHGTNPVTFKRVVGSGEYCSPRHTMPINR